MKAAYLIALVALAIFMACDSKTTAPPAADPISISTPADGAVLGDMQVIRAVSGNELLFDRVVFVIDADSAAVDSISPYEYQWNVFRYESGTVHIIFAIGFRGDSVFVSNPISVTIQYESGFTSVGIYQPTSQHAVGITAFGNVVFVSNLDAGLEMLDVTARSAPSFLARYHTPGQVMHAAVAYPYVYIADRDQGVAKAFFADVDSIIPVDRFNTQNLAVDVAVSDNFVFALENNGLSILSPSSMDAYSRQALTQDLLNYIVARHDTAFVIGNAGLYIVDCTNPMSPGIIGSYDNLNLAQAVAVADSFAFIANGSDGVIALSIANPANPRFLARFNPGFIVTAVDAGDGVLFAGVNSGLVYALDYSTSGSLTQIDSHNVNALVEEIDYDANYLYVAATNTVAILRFVP